VILIVGILLGLIAGCLRAWLVRRPYELPDIRHAEVAFLSFLPQALVFFVPQTGRFISQQWAALILPLSLAILVVFVWYNRRLQGFWLLGLGLLLNLAVIVANGGLMPISPETLAIVHSTQVEEVEAAIDSRAFGSKSVVLPVAETRLEWLADRFTVPDQLPIQFAYSLGDLFLVLGAFWALFVGGAMRQHSASAPVERQSVERQSYSSQS
jgi:hypothetical protein